MRSRPLVLGGRDDAPEEPPTSLRARLLAAREAREERIRRLVSGLRDGCLVSVGLSIPGEEKNPPGAERVVGYAAAALSASLSDAGFSVRSPGRPAEEIRCGPSRDDLADHALGPCAALAVAAAPERVKSICVSLEETLPWGRLLDLDVYIGLGAFGLRQVGRGTLGLPGRRCLLCEEPARECILRQRHLPAAVAGRTRELLEAARVSILVRDLAASLVEGARAELDLTPKPGLVDRRDNGSHPDLSYEAMIGSIELLPAYYRDLIGILESAPEVYRQAPPVRIGDAAFARCLAAGQAAERRMYDAIGANAHRGYLFLSGLVLLAAWEAGSMEPTCLRPSIASLARRFFLRTREARGEIEAAVRPGERLRREQGVGGIEAEARAGLPAVFEQALPSMRLAETPGGPEGNRVAWLERENRAWRALAELMIALEDTTAIHRCGQAGLERVHRDGARLRAMLARGEDPVSCLAQWNEEYRTGGLTMGGVADCLALAMALTGRD